MSQRFSATDLAESDIARALPLLQTTWPELDRLRWRDYVTAFRGGDAAAAPGIVGLFDSTGALCGLFACRVEQNLHEGRILAVALFTVLDVANSLAPVRALLDAAVDRAKAQHCRGVEFRLGNEQSNLVKRLSGLGLQRQAALHSLAIILS